MLAASGALRTQTSNVMIRSGEQSSGCHTHLIEGRKIGKNTLLLFIFHVREREYRLRIVSASTQDVQAMVIAWSQIKKETFKKIEFSISESCWSD